MFERHSREGRFNVSCSWLPHWGMCMSKDLSWLQHLCSTPAGVGDGLGPCFGCSGFNGLPHGCITAGGLSGRDLVDRWDFKLGPLNRVWLSPHIPSLMVISRALEKITDLGHLGLEKSLEVLLLALDMASPVRLLAEHKAMVAGLATGRGLASRVSRGPLWRVITISPWLIASSLAG